MSLYSVDLHAKQIDVEINAGCQPVVTALMVFPAIRLGASAQFLWASSVTVGLESNVQVHVCDNVEEALEEYYESWNNFDTEKFLDENCNGEYGACDAPLLDVTGCGMFHICPQSPYDCEFNTLRCIDSMLNLSDGYTITEVVNATIYIISSYYQGYWHHEHTQNNDISFNLK